MCLQDKRKDTMPRKQLPDKAPMHALQRAFKPPSKALPFLSEAADKLTDGLHKPVGLVLSSAYILGTACQLSGAV